VPFFSDEKGWKLVLIVRRRKLVLIVTLSVRRKLALIERFGFNGFTERRKLALIV